MLRQKLNHFFAVAHPAGVNFLAEHNLRVGIVHLVVKFEFRILPRLFDRPSRKAARHFRNIFLRVAAVHSKRVQLHQFAAVIFIQPAVLFFLLLLLWRRRPSKTSVALACRAARSAARRCCARGSTLK